MRDAFIRKLSKLVVDKPEIILVTGDLGYNVLTDFAKQFPRNFLNAGVAEQNMTGLAAGMAHEGRIVFTYSIANFPTLRCLEQLRNDACYHGLNVNVVAIGGGFSYGQQGFTHHATEDLSILRSLPETTVVAPICDWETEQATAALTEKAGVGYLRLDRSSSGDTSNLSPGFTLGRSRVLMQGSDLTVVCCGGIAALALDVAAALKKEGIGIRLLSMHTIKPLDVDALVLAAQETGGILSLEESTVEGGLGGAIAENLLELGCFPRVFHRIGMRLGFARIVGTQDYLRSQYGLDRKAIEAQVRKMLRSPRKPKNQIRDVEINQ